MLKSFSQYLKEKEDPDQLIQKFATAVAQNSKVKESPAGSNNSPEIKKMLSNVGINSPAAWCAAFVSWIFDLAFGDNPPFKTSASVLSLWKNAPESMKISIDAARKNTNLILPGMIFIKSRGGANSGKGHTGIVLGFENNQLKTIEGNTNDELSGEGQRVGLNIEKGRQLSDSELLGFIDPFLEYRSDPGFNQKLTDTVNSALRNVGVSSNIEAPAKSDDASGKDSIQGITNPEVMDTIPGATPEEIKSNPIMKNMIMGITKMALSPVMSQLSTATDDASLAQALNKFSSESKKDPKDVAVSVIGSLKTLDKVGLDSSKIAAEFGMDESKLQMIVKYLNTFVPADSLALKQGDQSFSTINQWNMGKPAGSAPTSGDIKMNLSGEKAANVNALLAAMERHGITNPYTKIAILGVVGKECNYIPKSESSYSNTSNAGLRTLFGARLARFSEDELTELKKNDVEFYDVIYGYKQDPKPNWNNGNTQPGDGYKYRGRGFNQITFKSTYQKYQALLSANGKVGAVDIVANPDQLNDVNVAAEATVLFFLDRTKSANMASKYGVSDINGFTDQTTALRAITNANAGWGKDIEGTRAYSRATEYAKNFSPTSQMA